MPKQATVYGSIEEFRQAARGSAEPVNDARVRASFDTEVKAADDGSRSLTFTISTGSVDRMGDTIAVAGWKLDAYRKNPVVLWVHDSGSLPVAKTKKIWIEGDKLKAETEFTPAGMARFNDTVFDMYNQGFLAATSVGFIPLKYAFTEDPARRYGIDFLEQELLEFSCCPIPANPEALIEGKAAGIDVTPMLDWMQDQIWRATDARERIVKLAEKVLGAAGENAPILAWAKGVIAASGFAVVTRERIEAIERAATAERLRRKRNREIDVVRARG